MKRSLLTMMSACVICAAVSAQSIDAVRAYTEILPSTRYNASAVWTAEVCVFNSGLNYFDRRNSQYYNQVWGTPEKDFSNNEWFMVNYSTERTYEEWSTETSPFCNEGNEAQYGRTPFVWAEESVIADVYLRRTFTTTLSLDGDVYLACGHDDAPAEWYLNGVQVAMVEDGWDVNEYRKLSNAQKALIKTDGSENVLAVHVHNNYGGSLADCGLYMTDSNDDGDGDGDGDGDDNENGLQLGYITPWDGKTLFCPERHYNGEWPVLCQAAAGDVYTVTLPNATNGAGEAQIHFRTPINLDAGHSYAFNMNLKMTESGDNVLNAQVTLADDYGEAGSQSVRMIRGRSNQVSFNISSTDINNLRLTVDAGGNSDNTVLEISDISLRDETENKEIWQGSAFYNLYYYAPYGSRTADPYMAGTTASEAWTLPDFDDSLWDDTTMPIGNYGFIREVQTIWPGGDYNNYWIRRTFNLDKVDNTSGYTLNLCHDDSYVLYVNGHFIATAEDWTVGKDTEDFEIPSSYLREGKNVIAVYQKQNVGGKFFDCGLTITPNAHEPFDTSDPTALVANELMVGNIDEFIDYSFNYGAWLELYNPTDQSVNIGGIYLSDDPSNLKKAMLPVNYGVIKPHGYKVIYFDHNAADGVYGKTADRQIGFQLDEEGGMLYVSNQDGTPFIEMPYPEAVSRCSYARKTDGTGDWSFTGDPSLGKSNNESDFASQRLEEPTVSEDSQLFTAPVSVSVGFPSTATLRYTTDGSAPTKTSAVSEDGQFDISETTTLRLRLFQKGMLPSPVVTRTFIQRDQDYYLPVIALSTANDNLYGDSIGIYVQGVNGVEGHGGPGGVRYNLNMDWERPVNVEYITPDGKMAVNQEAEMSIMGGWSRLYAPSSFKLKARNLYDGKKQFDHQFFPLKPYNKYKVIAVRNGGNDNDSPQHGRIKDAIIQQPLLSSGIYVDCQDYQPAHVFFNGRYIGMLSLREPSTKFYGTANYGYDKDNMDAFEYSNGYFQKAGDDTAFREWVDLSSQVSSPDKYEEYRQKVDVDEFINYIAAITYIGSSDWICNSNNSKGFRSRDDGKFHMVLFDVDWGFSNPRALSQLLNSYANDLIRIFRNSLANDEFKRQFIDSYCLMGGSVYTPQRVTAIADSIAHLIEPALALEDKQPWTSYNELVPRMVSSSERETRIQTLRECMQLGEGMKMKLQANIPEAQLRLNGLNVPLAKFDGTVFAPFTLEASAPAGYNFKGWRSNVTAETVLTAKGDEWEFNDQGSLDDTDWKTAASVSGWSSGPQPIGYGKDDIATQATAYHPTYYLRKTVTLDEEPYDDDEFTMNYAADDGWVVYVNGTEAARYLMPEGPTSYETFATTYADGNPDRGSVTLPANLFHKGENIIAVDLHNNKMDSSDIYWNVDIVQKKSGGSLTYSGRTYEITEDEDQDITAVFEPIDDSYLVYAGATPVVINEVSAANTIFANDYNKRNDWIELYNTTSEPVDVNGMFLSDNPSQPRKYQITSDGADGPVNTVIPAHGHLVVWADKVDPLWQLHTNFKLGNNDDECVVLTAADGSWKDQITYVAHAGEESVGRYPDGGKRVFLMTRPTIAAQNQLTTYSEWLYGQDEDFDPTTGINDNGNVIINGNDNGNIVSTEYFTADGIRINKPQQGINILRITYSNGTVETRKIMKR